MDVFKETKRALRQLEGTTSIPVTISCDGDGYFDRECPSEECKFQFKVLMGDWKAKVRDEEVFCPFCGHTADSTEWNTEEQIEQLKQAAIEHLRSSMGNALRRDADRWNRDTAESVTRLIVENGLQNAVTAFQRCVEAMFSNISSAPTARRNAFQNLAEGSRLWLAATGKAYRDHLSEDELNRLNRSFQQRHLLAHTQGIVDQDYQQERRYPIPSWPEDRCSTTDGPRHTRSDRSSGHRP